MKKLFFIAVIFFAAANVNAEQINSVVAKVNNDVITNKDLEDYCNVIRYQTERGMTDIFDVKSTDFKKRALDKMIEEKLILMAAKSEQKRREEMAKKDEKNASQIKLQAPETMIEKQVAQAMADYPDREAFEKSLAESGLNNLLLRERFRDQWLMQAIVEVDVSMYVNVAPQEALEFYRKHRQSFHSAPRYKLYMGRFIENNDWEEFRKLFLSKGIEAAQQQFSHIVKPMDAVTARLRPEFVKALSGAKEKTHFTVKIDNDKYFIYVIERIDSKQLEYKQVEKRIVNFLWYKKFRRSFRNWLSKLREQSLIRIYL